MSGKPTNGYKISNTNQVEPEVIALYQNAFRKSGRKGILLEIIKQDKKIVATDNNADLLYEIACFSAMLGNNDQSFEYLDKAFETRRSTTNIIKVDPSLDSLHSDPRFEQLVKRSGLG